MKWQKKSLIASSENYMNLPELPKEFSNPIKIEEALSAKPERYWVRRGEKRVLLLFHLMSERVPAYKDFLQKRGLLASHFILQAARPKQKTMPPSLNYICATTFKFTIGRRST